MLNNITFDKISDLTGQKGVEGVHLGGSVRVRDSINVLKNIKTGLLDVDNIRIDGNTISSTDTDGDITLTPLHILGNASALRLEGTDHVYIELYPAGEASGRKGWIGYGSSDSTELNITNQAADKLHFRTDEDVRMTIGATGNVGIGTDVPEAKLHIRNGDIKVASSPGTGSDATIILTANESGSEVDQWRISIDESDEEGANNLYFYDDINNQVRMTLEQTGNVGIGTNAPEGKLSVGSGNHVIVVDQPVRFADNGDNSVCVELSNVKIPAKAIITRVAAVVKVLSSAAIHDVNIQMSATSGTAAHAAISSGFELLGAGALNTDSTDSTSASAISLGTSMSDLKDVWINNDVVINGTSDQYLYICNDGVGNTNESTPTLAVLTVIVEYYGMD